MATDFCYRMTYGGSGLAATDAVTASGRTATESLDDCIEGNAKLVGYSAVAAVGGQIGVAYGGSSLLLQGAIGGGTTAFGSRAFYDATRGEMSSAGDYARDTVAGAGLGVGGAILVRGGQLAWDAVGRFRSPGALPEQCLVNEAATGGVDEAVDAAFASGRVTSGTMVRAPARGVGGSGPKQGQGAIWYHDNVKVPGDGPDGATVNIRTHSPNPNAPPGSYSRSNYTTQVSTNNGRYLLPDGQWKTLGEMTPAERAAAHYPAGK